MTTTDNPATADLNLVMIRGQLSAPIQLETFPTGGTCAKLLVTVRTTDPVRRVDVLPVTLWEPDPAFDLDAPLGTIVTVAATIRRRFWAADAGRRSRLELVADTVTLDKVAS